MAEGNPQAAQLSVEQLVRYTRNPKANEVIAALDEALRALNTPENAISPSERKLVDQFKAIEVADKAKAQKPADHRQNAICPGQPWLDTKGERIQAHGGAVIFEDGLYYWYDENKEHTDVDPASPRIIRIKNTLSLGEIQISEAMLPEAEAHPNLSVVGGPEELVFDENGNL